MTVNELHDALNLLPSDMIAAADRVRTGKKPKVIPWRRVVSLAACVALVVFCGGVVRWQNSMMKGAAPESMMQDAPAAAAPREEPADSAKPVPPPDLGVPEFPAEEAVSEEAAEEGVSANSAAMGTEDKAAETEHSHRFAEEREDGNSTAAYCGNTLTTVYLDEMNYTLAGSYSVKITDILRNLDYDPEQVCRCMAEFTVDTETLRGIEVNLTEGVARCELGQAALTEQQTKILREIIENLE